MVHLLGARPDGSEGVVSLAIAAEPPPHATMILRAHRERPGVPPSHALPVLQRLREGCERGGQRTFVLGLELPDDATVAQCFQLAAIAAEAGIASLVVDTVPSTSPRRDGLLALDLDGRLFCRIGDDPVAMAKPPADAALQPFGCRRRPVSDGLPTTPGLEHDRAFPWRPSAGDDRVSWWCKQQRDDGALGREPGLDLDATAWCTLALAGDGCALDHPAFCRQLHGLCGWLVATQRADGSWSDEAPGAVLRHVVQTYALVELTAASPSGDLLWRPTVMALEWLLARRNGDGGFGEGRSGASDAIVTSWVVRTVAAAEAHGLPSGFTAAELLGWFDRAAAATPAWRDAAAELMARHAASPDAAPTARLQELTQRVAADCDADDPHGLAIAATALFCSGGDAWRTWHRQLEARVVKQQVRDGERKGSWPARGGWSTLATTALHVQSLQAYYRYSRLVR